MNIEFENAALEELYTKGSTQEREYRRLSINIIKQYVKVVNYLKAARRIEDLYYRVKDENEQLKKQKLLNNEKIKKLEVSVANLKENLIKERKLEERYCCIKLFQTWLKLSDANFPIIFLQSIAAIAKVEDNFKIGCIEFLRMTSISRPDLVSTVGGFAILINALFEENLPKNLTSKIIISIIYVINTPNKRKCFNGFGEFYKLFSVFTLGL